MNRAVKYGVSGVLSIIAGIALNELAIWLYYQMALASYSGTHPPPLAIIVGTGFLILVPVGVLLMVYSGYILFSEYEIVPKKESGSG